MEKPIRSATSPDGSLTLELYGGDDFLLGFKGHEWHTHGDLLAPGYGDSPPEAAVAFFESIISDAQPICFQAETSQAWVTDSPEAELSSAGARTIIIRLWSGKVVGRSAGA